MPRRKGFQYPGVEGISALKQEESAPISAPKIVDLPEDKMQKIHHIVRTATLDNQFHDTGAVPLGLIEKDINSEWLAKGWQMLSTAVLRVGQSEFEILYTLVQNVP